MNHSYFWLENTTSANSMGDQSKENIWADKGPMLTSTGPSIHYLLFAGLPNIWNGMSNSNNHTWNSIEVYFSHVTFPCFIPQMCHFPCNREVFDISVILNGWERSWCPSHLEAVCDVDYWLPWRQLVSASIALWRSLLWRHWERSRLQCSDVWS